MQRTHADALRALLHVTASTIFSALTLGTVIVGGLWSYYGLYKR